MPKLKTVTMEAELETIDYAYINYSPEYYRDSKTQRIVSCADAVAEILDTEDLPSKIGITLSNQKLQGYIKFKRIERDHVQVKYHPTWWTCNNDAFLWNPLLEVLNDLGIDVGDYFWVKVKKA